MILNERFYQLFKEKAQSVKVDQLCLGLGYTVVSTSDGGVGIAYTYFDSKNSCVMHESYDNPEGKSAINLLEKIYSDIPIQRSMALAVINALNFHTAQRFPEGQDNQMLLENLRIGHGARIAMVGLFKPLVRLFEKQGAELEVYDIGQKIGTRKSFYEKLNHWAEVVIITSTTLLNNTTEEILGEVGKEATTILLGPTTPMVGEAFASLPVDFLGGTVPMDVEGIFRSIRHGTGTPIIQKFGRKVLLDLG